MAKLAILQCSDSGPVESFAAMLRVAGYECFRTSERLNRQLRQAGCDTVLDVKTHVGRFGYDAPAGLPEAGPDMMARCDLFGEIKAQRSYAKIVARWPNLAGKVLWLRINGGEPQHVIDHLGDRGDEIDPPCPVLTPNLWYRTPGRPWSPKAYACYPPFVRQGEYYPVHGRPADGRYEEPLCLVHNLAGWGWGPHAEGMRSAGVKLYGAGSPDGLIQHATVPRRLGRALAYVHLKTNDAPGYALYEALAAGCPVVCSERLLLKCLMGDLLVGGETCLVFDRPATPELVHHGHTPGEITANVRQVFDHLERLRDPAENLRIGLAGRRRLLELMWDAGRDGESFGAFMGRWFP